MNRSVQAGNGSRLPERDLVLLGAGHTNLHIVRMWRMQPIDGVRLTLVSPFREATYSGMLPGTLAGLYRPEEMRVDLDQLTQTCGVRFVHSEAIGLDPHTRRIELLDRPPIRYDVVGIGIGSIPLAIPEIARWPQVVCIKPMATFFDRLESAVARVHDFTADESTSALPLRVAVVGAGAGGCEIALGVSHWLENRRLPSQVCLIDAHAELLRGYSSKTQKTMRAELQRRSIELLLNQRIQFGDHSENTSGPIVNPQSIDPKPNASRSLSLSLSDNSVREFDLVLWATVAAAPPALDRFSLPKDERGFLLVDDTLRTTGQGNVFVVGDSAGFQSQPLPKAGVYAVRQGPILWENVKRTFAGQPLIPYRPQRQFLSLLSLGDGRAIADYRGWSASGTWAWRWKDYIDRKFMRMFRVSPIVSVNESIPRSTQQLPLDSSAAKLVRADRTRQSTRQPSFPQMRCNGCGSKIGAGVLDAVLRRLGVVNSGANRDTGAAGDDAVVVDRSTTPIDLLTVDFFPAFLDDPYLVGRIAALHALSDLFAMGGTPNGALAMVTIPPGSPSQQTELLYQLLAGGMRELNQAGAALWGGHTTEGPELVIGFCATGALKNGPALRKGRLAPGDQLLLTKPLGVGTILAAHQISTAPSHAVSDAIATMLQSNMVAADIAQRHRLQAGTDITGFGLAGHLVEMLEASSVSARIHLASLPLLDGFVGLARAGVASSLAPSNRERVVNLHWGKSELVLSPAGMALFDPQTSGGLLLAVPKEKQMTIEDEFRSVGYSAYWIGEVLETCATPQLFVE